VAGLKACATRAAARRWQPEGLRYASCRAALAGLKACATRAAAPASAVASPASCEPGPY